MTQKPVKEEEDGSFKEVANSEELFKYLGGRGRFTWLVGITLLVLEIFPGLATVSFVFTTAKHDFACDTGILSNATETNDCFTSVSLDQCTITTNCTNGTAQTRKCSAFAYNRTQYEETIISKFDLVCDRAFLSSSPSTAYFAGFLIGSSLYGFVTDAIGRQKNFYISALNLQLCMIGSAFAPNFWLHVIVQCLAGIGNAGMTNSIISMALECTDMSHRLMFTEVAVMGWSVGLCMIGLISYLYSNYQIIHCIIAVSLTIGFPAFWFIGESPRWLVTKRKFKEADKQFQRIARMNRKALPLDFTTANMKDVKEAKEVEEKQKTVWHLLKSPGLRKMTLLNWITFNACSSSYYGITMGVGTLGGNIYLNQVYSSILEQPARLLMIIVSRWIGRRLLLIICYIMITVSIGGAGILFLYDDLTTLRIIMALNGKFWATIAFDTVWVYAGECFPTMARLAGMGSCSTMARVGSMLSTVIGGLSVFWLPLPFLLLSSGPLVACVAVWFLPETAGLRLPDTMEEGEAFARKRDGNFCLLIRANGDDDVEEDLSQPDMPLMLGDKSDPLLEKDTTTTA